MTIWGEMLDRAYEEGQRDAMKEMFRKKFAAKPPESKIYIVQSLYRAGWPIDEIADYTGLTHNEIRDIIETL